MEWFWYAYAIIAVLATALFFVCAGAVQRKFSFAIFWRSALLGAIWPYPVVSIAWNKIKEYRQRR